VEDLIALHHMLENETHIVRGHRIAKSEWEKRKRLEKEFEEEEVEDPSALGVAWDIVGWDSAGEFASDVALTVATAGVGKVFKWVVKGRRAMKKLQKLKKLAKLRKARKARRLQRLTAGASKLARAVGEALKFEGLDYVLWVKKNWPQIARAYVTDELGEQLGGGDATKNKNILERLSKETVGAYVSKVLGISSSDEKKQFQTALLAFAAGASGLGKKELRRYFVMNLKRRLLTNSVYYSLRVGTGETALSAEVLVDISTKTVGEMADDFADRLIASSPLTESAIELARKAIETAVTGWIKSGLK
jgi:hypothetical protein